MCDYCNTGMDNQPDLLEVKEEIFGGELLICTGIKKGGKLDQIYLMDGRFGELCSTEIKYCPMCGRKLSGDNV